MTEKICFKYLRNILSGTLLLMAAGCAKDVIPEGDVTEEDPWVYDLSLPVPIQFSSSGMTAVASKAIVPGMIDGGSMANLDVGVYALEVTDDHQPDPSGEPENNRFNTHQYPQTWDRNDPESLLLVNEKVTISDAAISLTDKYYPLTDDRQYSFYSYYPYNENATLGHDGNGDYYYVTFTDLGNTDILYAYHDAHRFRYYPDELGFNAGYIRFLKSKEEKSQYWTKYRPNLIYDHLLTALVIQAESSEAKAHVRIQKVELTGVQTSATLYIADNRATGNMSGKLVGTGEADGTISLKNAEDGDDFSGVVLTSDLTVLSEFLVLPASEYRLSVTYGNWNGTTNRFEGATITKNATVSLRNKAFEADKIYNVNITVEQSPNVDVIASLNGFDTEDKGEADFTWD